MRTVLGEAIPSTVMFIMEFCTISLTIMAKTIISRGMSPFVFVVYTNALGSILLLLYSCLCYRNQYDLPHSPQQLPPNTDTHTPSGTQYNSTLHKHQNHEHKIHIHLSFFLCYSRFLADQSSRCLPCNSSHVFSSLA